MYRLSSSRASGRDSACARVRAFGFAPTLPLFCTQGNLRRRAGPPLDALSLDCGADSDSQTWRAVTLLGCFYISNGLGGLAPHPDSTDPGSASLMLDRWPTHGMTMISAASLQSGGPPPELLCPTILRLTHDPFYRGSRAFCGLAACQRPVCHRWVLCGFFSFPIIVSAPVLARVPLFPKVPRPIAARSRDRIFRRLLPWLTFAGLLPVLRGDRGPLQGPSCRAADTTQFNPALDTRPDMNVSD